ncbi:MAG: hypothetical protein ACREK5_04280, partial [Gemmatimonadota bacterium]
VYTGDATMELRAPFRFRSASILSAAALLILASATAAQTDDAAPAEKDAVERCRGPEHRQFDFWLGAWEVRNAEGELVGHNEIQRVARGCGLLENWRGVGGGRGMSINTYDADREKWTQRWVGAGATLWLEGGLQDGRMVLAATAPRSTPRGEVLDRVTWTPLPDGRVRQVWEISADGGESWREHFVGLYSPAGSAHDFHR